jgi:hypothetical protein
MRHDLRDTFPHSSNPHEQKRDLLLCAAGAFGLALMLALVARWLLVGAFSEGAAVLLETGTYRDRHRLPPQARARTWLAAAGGTSGLIALLLIGVGFYSLWAALKRR